MATVKSKVREARDLKMYRAVRIDKRLFKEIKIHSIRHDIPIADAVTDVLLRGLKLPSDYLKEYENYLSAND